MIFFAIAGVAGVVWYRYWAFWRPVVVALLIAQIGTLLFWASGTRDNPGGDGLVTAYLRNLSNDGPEVLWGALGAWGAIVASLVLLWRAQLATRPPHPGKAAGAGIGVGRKVFESMGVVIGLGVLTLINGAALEGIGWSVHAAMLDPEEELAQSVAAERQSLPRRLDQVTILTDIRADGMTVTYEHTLSVETDQPSLEAFFPNIRQRVCSDPEMVELIRQGVSYRYAYTTPSGVRAVADVGSCGQRAER